MNVTIYDKATRGHTTVQAGADGTFSSPQPIGDSYTVCVASPGDGYHQTFPAKDTGGCVDPRGYTVSNLGLTGSSGNNFGFQALSTISGRVYNDSSNENGTYDSGEAQAWTVNLYKGTDTTPVATTTSSSSDGLYTLKAQLENGTDYTVCEIPGDSNVWAQGIPDPTTDDVCQNLDGLRKGHVVTGTGQRRQFPTRTSRTSKRRLVRTPASRRRAIRAPPMR